MDKYIGIIAAEDKELEAIKEIMSNVEEIKVYNLIIYKGKINNKNCLLVKCGIGKVNSARTTQILTDKFNLEYIINTGSAGSLNDNLKIGDIVIGEELIQHDFDVTAFGREKGYIPGVGKEFKSDENLIKKCSNIKLNDLNITKGTVVSGDIFCTDIKMKEKIRNKFNSDCTEMEGAAIAQVCFLNQIPFVIIRSISDIPNGNNKIDFEKFLESASKNCAKFISKLV
ncbi:MAG: 5'-methylthioadenosine/adenosylhomocysteine nucleosidase [Clostridia bacterium]|nr:5'-methylthioadenosine/adenosylhomocysteine nucleosidase [Clostridia bacterium]